MDSGERYLWAWLGIWGASLIVVIVLAVRRWRRPPLRRSSDLGAASWAGDTGDGDDGGCVGEGGCAD